MTHSIEIDLFESVDRFVAAAVSGELTEDIGINFARILQKSDDACDMYAECVQMSLLLPSVLAAESDDEVGPCSALLFGQEDSASPPTIPPFLSTALHGTIGFFSEGMPLAYLLATVITAMGLLVGSLIHVSGPEQVAKSVTPIASPAACQTQSAGRITDMVDCKWLDPSTAPVGLSVSPGQRFVLASGLVEMTYDTGTKVILQGPARYEAESGNGGFLSLGKLTARVGKKNAKDGRQKVDSPLSTLHSPPFCVRTPTAVVTDLGTEFGVNVDRAGDCEVQVLRGHVQAEFVGPPGHPDRTVQLHEGEGCRYERKLARVTNIAISWTDFEPAHIGQRDQRCERWLAYSRQLRKDPALVAYYTFESRGARLWSIPNQSAAGHLLDATMYYGTQWANGRLPGKLGLHFHGPGSGDKVILPCQERFRFTGPFSVAVWFKADRFTSQYQALVTKGDDSWELQQRVGSNALTFDTKWECNPGGPQRQTTVGHIDVADHRWHLVVAVCEPVGPTIMTRLYIDGQLDGESRSPSPLHQNDHPVWLGATGMSPDCEFRGWIDEVAIFARALSAGEAAAMFEAGSPASAQGQKTKAAGKGPRQNVERRVSETPELQQHRG